jgi:GT2 family glycosyltransferase
MTEESVEVSDAGVNEGDEVDGTEPVEEFVRPEAIGAIEALEDGGFTGWAIAVVGGEAVPILRVRIIVEGADGVEPDGGVEGDEIAGEGFATIFRRDLVRAGLPTGWCGYRLVNGLDSDGIRGALLRLQCLVDEDWVDVTTVSGDRFVERALDVEIPTGYVADLLTVFVSARTLGATIGKQNLSIGEDIWAAAASNDAEASRLSLNSEESEDTGERPFLRMESHAGTITRVDTRFRLRRAVESGQDYELVAPVRVPHGESGQLRLSVFVAGQRTNLATFVVPVGTWVELAHALPRIDLPPMETEGLPERHAWLEVTATGLTALDIGQLRVDSRLSRRFECPRVEAQQVLLDLTPELAADEPQAVDAAPPHEPEAFSVVIPFFGNRALTRHCVDAVLANSRNAPHVVLVDDGSGHPVMDRLLGGLAEHVQVVRFPANRGYTAAVNAGVRAATTRKVIILNNDTRVLPGWDVALLAALEDEEVFAAGPISNAASYQSFPEQRSGGGWAVNELPREARPEGLANELADRFGVTALPWRILNGFCYAVRTRDFLELGGLDVSAFPRGYGEEVDLMLRALDAGFRNVITPGSFVYHYKSKTFAGERKPLTDAANQILRQRWSTQLTGAVEAMDSSLVLEEVRVQFAAALDRLRGVSAR